MNYVKFCIEDPVSLSHHGIKGQRWGVKNGPPYPLSKTDHMKVVGRSVASGGLFGNKHEEHEDQEECKRELSKRYGVVSDRDPDRNMADTNKVFGTTNCVACSYALLLRVNHGIAASAKDTGTLTDDQCRDSVFKVKPEDETWLVAEDAKTPIEGLREVEKQALSKYKNGDNGALQVLVPDLSGAHYITWFIEDGKVVYRDPQLAGLMATAEKNPFAKLLLSSSGYSDSIPSTLRTDEEKTAYFTGRFATNAMKFIKLSDAELTSTSRQERNIFSRG